MHHSSFASRLVASLLGAVLVASSPLAAQTHGDGPVHVGITGGISLPGGEVGEVTNTGWNAGALVSVGALDAPLRFRIDGQWNQFNGKPQVAGDRPTEYDDFRVIDATANALYSFPSTSTASFYVLAGAGIYAEKSTRRIGTSTTAETATRGGVNAGAGVRFQLSRVSAFVELRYHYILRGEEITPYDFFGNGHRGTHIFPLSVGIML